MASKGFPSTRRYQLSLLVPVLNEEEILNESLQRLHGTLSTLADGDSIEVLISDSGSTDESLLIAETHVQQNANWKLIHRGFAGPASIGKAVLQAAGLAQGRTLVVHPVDLEIPAAGLQELLARSRKVPLLCGGFPKRYTERTPVLVLCEWLLNAIRAARLHNLVWTNAMFFPQTLIASIPTFGFLEDLAFSDELKRQDSNWILLKTPVKVSARRYLRDGVLARALTNILILALYRLGFSDIKNLRSLYRKGLRMKLNPITFFRKEALHD